MVLVILCVQRMVSTAMQSWTLQRVGILCLFTSFFIHPSWRTREETKTKTVWLQRNLFVVARLGLEVSVGTHFILHLQFLALDYIHHCFPLDPDGQKNRKTNRARSCTAAKHFRDCFFLKRHWFSSVLFRLVVMHQILCATAVQNSPEKTGVWKQRGVGRRIL